MVFKEIFAAPLHFGIGMTNSGGNRGMAALEGLVSALEVSQTNTGDDSALLTYASDDRWASEFAEHQDLWFLYPSHSCICT